MNLNTEEEQREAVLRSFFVFKSFRFLSGEDVWHFFVSMFRVSEEKVRPLTIKAYDIVGNIPLKCLYVFAYLRK